jgi:hypothetical protein
VDPDRPPSLARYGWAATAAVLIVVGTLVVAGGPGDEQPSPPASTPASSGAASQAPPSEPNPTVAPDPVALLETGGRVTISAIDERGPWGTITIRRRDDVGGFRQVSNVDLDPDATDARAMFFQNDPTAFYVVLEVAYRADRQPRVYGAQEWALRIGPDGALLAPIERGGLANDLPVNLPGVNFELSALEYFLIFEVPRAAANQTLNLRYGPPADRWEAPVRGPSPAPEPVATIVPPLPVPEGYVSSAELPISVLFSPEADDLFATPDTCTNPEVGYTVTFPDDWWTNTAIGDVAACSWFSPVHFEVDASLEVPDEVAITFGTTGPTQGIGLGGQDLPSVPDIETLDGLPAGRGEQVGVGGGFFAWGVHRYTYLVGIDGAFPRGEDFVDVLVAGTAWDVEDDPARYIVHKAVLDRMMASITFDN